MFRRSAAAVLLAPSRLAGVNPWRRRPATLAGSGAPQMAPRSYLMSKRRRKMDPDDNTGLLLASHVILKQCPNCHRYKQLNIKQRQEFHTCCEGHVMRERGNLKRVQNLQNKLGAHMRQWDFDKMRPKDNAHRPGGKHNSKFKKK
jgi:hypothetical protein